MAPLSADPLICVTLKPWLPGSLDLHDSPTIFGEMNCFTSCGAFGSFFILFCILAIMPAISPISVLRINRGSGVVERLLVSELRRSWLRTDVFYGTSSCYSCAFLREKLPKTDVFLSSFSSCFYSSGSSIITPAVGHLFTCSTFRESVS